MLLHSEILHYHAAWKMNWIQKSEADITYHTLWILFVPLRVLNPAQLAFPTSGNENTK